MIVKKITVQANEGQEEALKTMLTSLIEASRVEEGCLRYDVFEIEKTPGNFLLIEIWQSDAHLDKHKETEHFLKFKEAASVLVASKTSDLLSDLSN
jgi:quinol monooxygenase YgiN